MTKPAARVLALVVVLLLAALGLAACGGGGGSKEDAASLMKQTFGAGHPIRSGRADVTLNVDLQGLATLSQPLGFHLTGPFQSNGGKELPDFAFDLDLNSGDRPVTVGAVFTQGAGYLTIEGQAFDMGSELYKAFKDGYEKAKSDSATSGSAGPSLKALGIDPIRWLKDPQDKGSEDIGGTSTEHVSSGVDVPKLLDDLSALLGKARGVTQAGGAAAAGIPTQLTAAQRDKIQRSVKSARLDVWTGQDDHTLRRVSLDVTLAVPQDVQASVGGLKSGHIALDATIAELNKPQRIAKPAGARPLADLRTALQQLGLTGTGASSPGSGSAGGGTSTTPSGPQGDYATCLQKAGNDLAAVQRCGDLLK